MLLKFKNCFSLLKNAWKSEYSESFVEYIQLDIPSGSEVDNPIEDSAFMERIGAKEICDFANLFELKNAVTGTRFTFTWTKHIVDSNVSYSICSLRRKEKIFGN